MATRWSSLPGLSDDVVERTKEDYRKYKKAADVDKSNLKGGAREAVKEAGARARNRNVGRAGAADASLQAGYELGRAIDEKTGLGKKLVNKSGLGDLAAKLATSGDRVKLSKEAQDRVDSAAAAKADKESTAPDTSDQGSEYISPDFVGYKRGGKVKPKKMSSGGSMSTSKASSRGDGIAQRGKTKGKYL